jgi:sigma-B regulation protein RsbU (phosphoserine phosphatase)
MCRMQTANFEGNRYSPSLARRWLAEVLERWELTEWLDTAELLATELVTNAVVHAATDLIIVLAVSDGHLELGVWDHSPYFAHDPLEVSQGNRPESLDLDSVTERGRGLLLVDALAEEWGVTGLTGGKDVWFQLDASAWPHRAACRCDSEDMHRVRLGSGRFALANSGPWDDPRPASDT